MERLYRVGRFGVDTIGDWARTLQGAQALLGPVARRRMAGANLRDRSRLHELERRWSDRALAHLRVELDLEGCEHIDPHQRYVVVPLHEGFLDPVVLFQLGLPLRFVARDELFDWRLLGRYLKRTGQIMVPTEANLAGYRNVIEGAGAAFAAGESLVMFPQGSILGIEIAFRRGPVRLATRFGRPLLPVVITGTHRVWEHPYSPRLRYGQRVSMSVMPPVPADEADGKWRELERSMKSVALNTLTGPPRRFVPERDGWWDGYDYSIDPDFVQLARRVAAHRRAVADGGPVTSPGDSNLTGEGTP